jgi:hypothetical protein
MSKNLLGLVGVPHPVPPLMHDSSSGKESERRLYLSLYRDWSRAAPVPGILHVIRGSKEWQLAMIEVLAVLVNYSYYTAINQIYMTMVQLQIWAGNQYQAKTSYAWIHQVESLTVLELQLQLRWRTCLHKYSTC